jgi:hypothetical protein
MTNARETQLANGIGGLARLRGHALTGLFTNLRTDLGPRWCW